MSRKSTMSAESKAIVDYLRKVGPTSRADLNTAIRGQTVKEIATRLKNLTFGGWVRYSPVYRVWEISPSAHGMFPSLDMATKRIAVKKARAAITEPVELVPPRTFNFHGTTYVPPQFTPARQGALDFGNIPSHGQRC